MVPFIPTFFCKFLPFVYALMKADTRPAICNHAVAIPVNNAEREKTDKLPTKNCQDTAEKYSISFPFYCFCVPAIINAPRATIYYWQS
jgi:hypothetical protein